MVKVLSQISVGNLVFKIEILTCQKKKDSGIKAAIRNVFDFQQWSSRTQLIKNILDCLLKRFRASHST